MFFLKWKNIIFQMSSLLKRGTSTPLLTRNQLQASQLPPKTKKQFLVELQSEVNKSRIAIENMSQAKALEGALYKRVEELQRELHRSILSINQQSSKNKALVEVIGLLKGQMSEVQAVQRNEQEYESNNFQKKIKKVEYDIKQILHKYNEEIAKINSLKEDANAARDERVVYSNLFNKIEKEIKHYEEIYKQTLIKNEIFLDKKKQNQQAKLNDSLDDKFDDTADNFHFPTNNPPPSSFPIARPLSLNQNPTANQLSKLRDTKSRQAKKSVRINQGDLFLTNVKESRAAIEPSRTNSDLSTRRDKNASLNQNIENMIREKEGNIERLIMSAECRDLNDALEHYSQIYSLNQGLFEEVQTLDAKISAAEAEIQRLAKQKRTSQVYQNCQITEFFNIAKKSRSNKNLVDDSPDTPPDELSKIAYQLCSLLGVEHGETLTDDTLREIDRQVDALGTLRFERRGGRKESKMVSLEEGPGTDRGVSEMLDKIEKFGESEKIFDRAMLKMEYQRELSKAKKKGKRPL